jgi:hypothetical protein
MAHSKADLTKAAELQNATAHLTRNLDSHRVGLKALLPPDLAASYSLCYWDNVGCYWCTDDGRSWYLVKCIT